MNISARISRAEKAVAAAGLGSKRSAALARYLQTGNPGDIPEGAELPDLQAAARRIPKTAAASFRGLAAIRAALGTELPAGADVQAFIEAPPRAITRVYNVKDDKERIPDAAADLLGRLGFSIIRINVIRTISSKAEETGGGK